MDAFILIHGAWHGAWCWQQIIPLLEQQGHKVIAPDLAGHGEDKTPALEITFDSYLESLEGYLKQASKPLVLVGHSFSGMIISSLAERYPDKVKKLIYIAGYLPQDGQSMFDVAALQAPTRYVRMMRADVKNNILSFPAYAMKGFAYHQCDDALFKNIQPLFCDEPYAPLITPVSLSEQRFGQIPRVYIECTQDKAILIDTQRAMLNKVQCEVYSLPTDHSPFYSDPLGLVQLLTKSC